MGLSIHSKSILEYRRSYGDLHQVRYMGYKAVGGEADYPSWHTFYKSDMVDRAYMEANLAYPNLYWHSDCDGEYTKDGKVGNFVDYDPLQTGNSVELLAELRDIEKRLRPMESKQVTEYDWQTFEVLLNLVEDVVEKHDGRLEFH